MLYVYCRYLSYRREPRTKPNRSNYEEVLYLALVSLACLSGCAPSLYPGITYLHTAQQAGQGFPKCCYRAEQLGKVQTADNNNMEVGQPSY